jgi:ArsR family transcriptional regulator, arsenate/arsenite/antimonite-responsive transcriptional repressor
VQRAAAARPTCGHHLSSGYLCLLYFDDTRKIVVNRYVEQFSALGQKVRLDIFRLLVRIGPQGSCVEEIKRRVRMPGSTLSHHLDALTRCGLLTARRSGRFIYYAIDWPKTAKLIRFMTEDCCADLHKTFSSSTAGATSARRKQSHD